MKRKGISLLAGIVAVGCLSGAYVLLKTQNEKTEEAEAELAEGETILEIDSGEITSVSLQTSDGTHSFTMEEDVWTMEEDETFPVDSSAVLAPLSQLAPLKAVRTLTDVEDAQQYGFDEPQNVITLVDAEEKQTVLTIGSSNSSTGDDYLMLNEDDSVIYTIDSAVCDAFSTELYDYARSEELPLIQASSVTGVTVERETDGYELYLKDALWKVKGSGTELDADSDAVNDALAGLGNLVYEDYLTHNCSEEDAAEYGLDAPAAVLTVCWQEEAETAESASEKETETETEVDSEADSESESESESETEIETEVQMIEKSFTVSIGGQDASGNYYVQQQGSAEVHTIAASTLETFLGSDAEAWEAETEAETEA